MASSAWSTKCARSSSVDAQWTWPLITDSSLAGDGVRGGQGLVLLGLASHAAPAATTALASPSRSTEAAWP